MLPQKLPISQNVMLTFIGVESNPYKKEFLLKQEGIFK